MTKPTKAQKDRAKLVSDTVFVTLSAGARVLQDHHRFDDQEAGLWVLKTAETLAQFIGTENLVEQMVAEYEKMATDG